MVVIGGGDAEALDTLTCSITPPLPSGSTSADPRAMEVFAQALSGIMAVHGRDAGRPRRLGLDVASAATGVLAATGLLASELARLRGARVRSVETSPVHAGLTFLTHHIAMATCDDTWEPERAGDAPGPPFVTADGAVVEMEAASHDGWVAFWQALGVEPTTSVPAWPAFAYRYNTAACALPPALHAAVAMRTHTDLLALGDEHRISICRQRGYGEVVTARDWQLDASSRRDDGARLQLAPPWLTHAQPAATRSVRPSVTPSATALLPLEGMRVVESTHGLPGPLAGRLLRMLGADVTRIEPPGGDPSRSVRPFAGEVGAGFVACNLGKTPIEIDYKSAAGRAAITELTSDADVFLHNWLPGRAEALGFDATSLWARNPGLVHLWVSGWGGATGADQRVGIEYFVQAHCGCGDGLTPEGTPRRHHG
jgi:crotonobetainyl-CoA:carnitine CoA-transferase CaiB-like acyl-CoA transferase